MTRRSPAARPPTASGWVRPGSRTLVVAALAAAAVAWLLISSFYYDVCRRLPWLPVVTLAGLAVLEAYAAVQHPGPDRPASRAGNRSTRCWSPGSWCWPRRPRWPAAIFAGFYAGLTGWLFLEPTRRRRRATGPPRRRVCSPSLALVAAALWLERSCRVPEQARTTRTASAGDRRERAAGQRLITGVSTRTPAPQVPCLATGSSRIGRRRSRPGAPRPGRPVDVGGAAHGVRRTGPGPRPAEPSSGRARRPVRWRTSSTTPPHGEPGRDRIAVHVVWEFAAAGRSWPSLAYLLWRDERGPRCAATACETLLVDVVGARAARPSPPG